jgi:alkyl hydroperoxide reductase subunit AhpC
LSTSRLDELYADEAYVSIHLDRESKCVLSEWVGFANSLEFRAGNMKVLQAIRDTHAVSVVIDNRRLEGVTPLDQLWIRDSFAPLMEAAGLRRMGLVVAARGLAIIATDEIRSQSVTRSAITTRVFGTVSEAAEWARGVDQSSPKR